MWNVNVIDEIFNKFVDVKAIYYIFFSLFPWKKEWNLYSHSYMTAFISGFFWLGFMLHQHCKGYMATSSFTGGGKPQVPLRALFQARAGTRIDPPNSIS